MNKTTHFLLIIGLSLLLFSCAQDKQPAAPAAKATPPAVAKKADIVKPVLAQDEEQKKPAYQVIGIRDKA